MTEKTKSVTIEKKPRTIQVCFWKQCAVFVGLMVVLFGVYYPITKYHKYQNDLKHLVEDNFNFVFQVDQILNEGSKFILDGWAFKLEEEANEGSMEFWLYDLQEDKIIYSEGTKYIKRPEINEYFLCEYDYTDCGIVASFNGEKTSLENKDYEILVSDIEGKKVYQTGTYISNGKLMYCLPEGYVPLDVEGTDIEKIVTDGVLRVYRPDVGMYVYQYDNELYWIAEPYYGFVDGDSYVHFRMDTSQLEKLPEHSLSNNLVWIDMGYYFNSRELTEWNTGKYRVARSPLPLDYSITRVWTGRHNHIDKWIWIQYFRPWYEFPNKVGYMQ